MRSLGRGQRRHLPPNHSSTGYRLVVYLTVILQIECVMRLKGAIQKKSIRSRIFTNMLERDRRQSRKPDVERSEGIRIMCLTLSCFGKGHASFIGDGRETILMTGLGVTSESLGNSIQTSVRLVRV